MLSCLLYARLWISFQASRSIGKRKEARATLQLRSGRTRSLSLSSTSSSHPGLWSCLRLRFINCLVRKGFHESLASFNDDFDLVSEVGRFAACGIIIDVWFYATHKMLHWPRFYKAIHKLHHRFKAPTAVASMYAHPVEFTIGNVLGVILGPAITNCHPFTACFWYAFSLISTGGSHSGYLFFSAEGHDAHHEFFNYNFGVSVFMDKLCGTCYAGSPLWEKNEAKKLLKGNKKLK